MPCGGHRQTHRRGREMTATSRDEAWQNFWNVIARAHADACRREAAHRQSAVNGPPIERNADEAVHTQSRANDIRDTHATTDDGSTSPANPST